MKLIVIHGDNVKASYERLTKLTDVAAARGWDIERISEPNLRIADVMLAQSLFGKEKLVVVNRFALLTKQDVSWLAKNPDAPGTLVIYNDALISKTAVKALPVTKVEEFKLPVLIWRFLDSFYPNNARSSLKLFREATATQAAEFVFAMLARHLRDLYAVRASPSNASLPAWRAAKLKSQAGKFKGDSLEEMVGALADADVKSKSSNAEIKDLLEFLILTKLE